MNEVAECGACCRGSAPWFMCRDKSCICHKIAHELAVSTPNRLSHRDPTANLAVGNVTRKNNK